MIKTKFTTLWILLLICLSTFAALGQNIQPIEPLKPNEILARYDSDVIKPYRGYEEWFLTKKNNLSGNQTLFTKSYRGYEDQWSLKTKSNPAPDNGQLISNSKDPFGYLEIPIGLMRTLTSRGDYGNLYFIGLGISLISYRFDVSINIATFGWGRTAKDVQYYQETWNAGSKTFGYSALGFDFGYNISPIKNVRFSPILGYTSVSEFGPRLKDKKKYSGLEKYFIREFLVPQVGFDIYYFKPNRSLVRLKYRYTNLSIKGDPFLYNVNINKHIITLGINLFNIKLQ